jgi:hypothetical protein
MCFVVLYVCDCVVSLILFLAFGRRFRLVFCSFETMELCILYTVGRTTSTNDEPCHKTATHTEQKHRKNANKHPCLKRDSNPDPSVFFLILDCEAIGTAATPGLLCQPRVIMKMIVEK